MFSKKQHKEAVKKLDGPDCLAFITTPRTHLYTAAAYRNMGEEKQANSKRSIAFAILDSISKTGDGTREKPWHVITVQAEYDFIRAALKAKRKSQNSYNEEKRQLDALTLDKGFTVFFDTTLHWKMLKKEMTIK